MEQIIKNLLDNDLYKFTQQNSVLKLYPRARVTYKFYNRGNTPFPDGFAEELRKQVKMMESIALTKEEKNFLIEKTSHYLDPLYFEFLEGYRYNSNEVGIIQTGENLEIQISGFWFRTILWEVPLMALVSELFFKMTNKFPESTTERIQKAQKKASFLRTIGTKFADFGTRRRYSYDNHDLVVKELKGIGMSSFVGTSNVHFAMKYNTTPIGTMAHEWIMFHAAVHGFKSANRMALKAWKNVYRGYLGTALSDTYTTNDFLGAFDKEFAELFTGVRQDSGDPIEFAQKIIDHYKSLEIDPCSKTIVFSDSLDVKTVEQIQDFCNGKIKTSYGIGTNFTNDVGVAPLNIVIKLDDVKRNDEAQLTKTVKLSDNRGKHTGNKEMIKVALIELGLKKELEECGFVDENGNVFINVKKI